MKRRLLLFFILFSSFAFGQNNIYRSGGITQTIGSPTFTPGASGNVVAIDTVTGEWYVNPNRLSGASWISAGYRLTNISGSVPPAYTPTAHQSHFVVNAANQLYYWNGSAWQSVGGGGGSTDALRLKFIVVNKSGGTINKGEVVYVSGAQGNRVAVKKALASQDSLSANTLGVMDETVANNGEGYCVAEGLVSGINTSAFTEGAALYLSPTTAGGITQTKTTAPDHLVLIGYCVKSNNASGEISVHIQNGYELGELHDVYVPTPANGQVLTYNTANTRWEAATVADQSATNELQTIDTFSLSGQTLSASLSSDGQPAKTVTLPVTNVTAGTGISVSSTTGNYTVTNSAPDQTVSISNGGGVGVTGTYPSFTLTATDQSITNEIQRLDTFSLSGQTLSASLLNDGVPASSVTLPIVDVVAGTNVTVTKSNGVATVSATGGGGLSGVTGYVSQFNSSTTIDTTGLFWNGRLGINTASPSARLDIVGEGITSGTNAIKINNSARELFKIANNGAITVGKNDVTITQNTASIESAGTDANIGIAIVPKGTGAITAHIPDGGTVGGNARGANSIDWQMVRLSSDQVASGESSVILGGQANRASGRFSIAGGYQALASGGMSVAIGGWPVSGTHTASGSYSTAVGGYNSIASGANSTVIGGNSNTSSAQVAIVTGGQNGVAYLFGQRSIASGRFAGNGDAQTSDLRARRAITGTGVSELTIDGGTPAAGNRLILALPTGATNGRLWNFIVQLSAICQTAGGSVVLGDSFIGTYSGGIKRIGANTSLVGTVQNMITAQADTNMSSSVVAITADDANDSLKIEFTPPTGANASTVIRVVATVYLTEVGY
jgi:hypothetical protein